LLNEALNDFTMQNKQCLGLVSVNIPLISNLDVWGNIALIRQYHQDMPQEEARQLVLQYLRRYGMESIAFKRNPALTHEERFCVMLLRAVMVADAVVVIDRPFQILPYLQDAHFIRDALKKVDDSYQESYVLDYTWNAHRYRIDNAEKS
jgi:ABC-type nitrate/sulfonate/bicarbonate transport system ATPase subunit